MRRNRPVVVDASVAIKWVVEEEFSDRADALYGAMTRAGLPMVAPPHFASEVTNALYQRTRKKDPTKHISETEVEQAIERFLRLGVELTGSAELYRQAFAFARTHRYPSLYDTLYVVLAQMLGTELWTADQALLRTVGEVAPWVRSIGEYPLLS